MQSGPSVGTDLTRAQLESHVGKGSRWRELKTIAHILFVVLDHDASGTISFSEFASGVALIKASRDSLSEDATKEFAFRALDLNPTAATLREASCSPGSRCSRASAASSRRTPTRG